MSGESSGTYQGTDEYMAEWEKRYARFRRRVPGEPILATIARLSYMVNGQIGRDWRSGIAFTLHDKGDDFTAIQDAVAALQEQRVENAALQQQLTYCKKERDEYEAAAWTLNGDVTDLGQRLEAAEAREKQVRAALAEETEQFVGENDDLWVSVRLGKLRALASREGGK